MTSKKPEDHQGELLTQPLALWQFVISVMGLIITCGVLIVNLSNKITEQGIKIQELQDNRVETRNRFDKVDVKLDGMSDQMTRVLIKMEDKKNR